MSPASARMSCTSVSIAGAAGGGSQDDGQHRRVARRVESGRHGDGDVVQPLECTCGRVGRGLGVIAVLRVDEHDQRAVGAGAEALGDQVVGATLGAVGGFGAVVGQAQLQVRRGYGDHTEGCDADHQHRESVSEHEPSPSGARTRFLLGVLSVAVTLLARQQSLPGEADQCGDQGQCDEDGEDHGTRGGQTHLRQDRDVDHEQAGQGDDDGETGEDHGGSGGSRRPADGVEWFVSFGEFGAVPGHDEQRVVDPDRQADHRGQDRSGAVELQNTGEDGDDADADADADQRGDQRQTGRDERTEGDQQHHRGDDDTDHLGDTGLRHREQRVTADLRDQAWPPADSATSLESGTSRRSGRGDSRRS